MSCEVRIQAVSISQRSLIARGVRQNSLEFKNTSDQTCSSAFLNPSPPYDRTDTVFLTKCPSIETLKRAAGEKWWEVRNTSMRKLTWASSYTRALDNYVVSNANVIYRTDWGASYATQNTLLSLKE